MDAGFSKKLKKLFKETKVKSLDTNSKDVFSYNDSVDYVVLYKKRLVLGAIMSFSSIFLIFIAFIMNTSVPSPRFFITTFNGHVYEIESPQGTAEGAIKINKSIEANKEIIFAGTVDK
jgi:hypothetical protein